MSHAAHRFDNDLRYRGGEHPNQTQLTPGYVLEPVRVVLGGHIGLDPCTEPDNPTRADAFYTLPRDGRILPWNADSIYVNPPYGKAREPWIKRCIQAGAEGQRVVLLIPAATDTAIFQQALEHATTAVLIKGRVKFGAMRPNRRWLAASHPSALIGWNVDLGPCAHLGAVIRPVPTRLAFDDMPNISGPGTRSDKPAIDEIRPPFYEGCARRGGVCDCGDRPCAITKPASDADE